MSSSLPFSKEEKMVAPTKVVCLADITEAEGRFVLKDAEGNLLVGGTFRFTLLPDGGYTLVQYHPTHGAHQAIHTYHKLLNQTLDEMSAYKKEGVWEGDAR